MTWLSWPVAAVAGAILVPLLVLLYFLKLKRRDVEISTTLLWKQTIRDMQANAPFQKLRRNLLLFLQLLILILGLLAIAQPQLSATFGRPPRSVLVIDRSASMLTADESDGRGGTISRLERAKRDALAFVDAMNEGGLLADAADLFGTSEPDEAMVIAFDAGGEVIQPFTSNKDLLRLAIESIEATHAGSEVGESVRLAGPYVTPRVSEDESLIPGAPIVLWSDGAIADLRDAPLHPQTELIYNRLGVGGTPNVAITAIRADRAYDNPDSVSVFVGLSSTLDATREVDVEFLVDGAVRSVRGVRVEGRDPDSGSPGIGGVVFRLDRGPGAALGARIVTDPQWDALAPDNEAWYVLAPSKRLDVALVTQGGMLLRHAMSSLALSSLDVLSPSEFDDAARRGRTSKYDAIVLDGWAPAGPLPPGKYLALGAVPNLDGVRLAPDQPESSVAAIVSWERDHPAIASIDLASVRIGEMRSLDVGREALVLATSTGGPAIVETIEGPIRAIVTAFDPADSNWPLDWGFLIFMATSVRILGEDLADLEPTSVRAGSVVKADLPLGVDTATLEAPDGGRTTLTPDDAGRVVFGPVDRTGLYTLRWRGEPGPRDVEVDGEVVRAFAVNMQNAHESRVESAPSLELPRGDVGAVARDEGPRERARPLWPWLLLAACAVLLIEWWVYNRRVYL